MSEKANFDANKAVEEIKKDRNLTLIAGGAIATIVGLFLPWATWTSPSFDFFGVSSSSVSYDFSPGLGETFSLLMFVFAIVAVGAALNVLKQDKATMAKLAVGVSAAAVVLALLNMPDTGSLGVASEFIDIGIGFWLAIAGSIVMTAGAVMKMQKENKKPAKKAAKEE